MGKNVVFCADGTWNGPGEADFDDPNAIASNVFKLFLSLAGLDASDSSRLAKEQESTLKAGDGSLVQVSKYLHGVGDSTNFLAKLMGGGVGQGLIARIVRGYTFVSRNYAAGDRIYLVGFSRGAYTARALAGLITAKGLLDPAAVDLDDRENAYRHGAAVWYEWRREKLAAAGLSLERLGDLVFDLPVFLSQPPDPATLLDAPIEAVAVWDTVGALGIPIFTDQHVAVDVFQFADTALSGKVKFGRHAVAIDEAREAFTPTLWDADAARITQVLFPGGHADVGGGYTTSNRESGLSDGALTWIRGELAALGVAFAAPLIVERPDPTGPAHREWLKPLWAALPVAPRQLPAGLGVSRSVIGRMQAAAVLPDPGAPAAPYRPTNIPSYLSGTGPAPGIVPV